MSASAGTAGKNGPPGRERGRVGLSKSYNQEQIKR